MNSPGVLLYSSYVLTCLEDRGWSFVISLVMQLLGGLQLVSIEQLAEGVAQMAFSGTLGKIVDQRSNRSFGMIVCLVGNNFSIILSAAFFVICLDVPSQSFIYTFFLVLGMMFCAFYRVFVTAEKTLVARDWAIVLATHGGIARTNALTTSLDQTANVISPLIIGALLSLFSLRTSCIVLGVASLLSFFTKSVLMWMLYSGVDRLRYKETKMKSLGQENSEEPEKRRLARFFDLLHLYYSQRVFPAALGMALLFMTVMGFDGLAVGYGQSAGLSESLLGFFRSFGSLAGVAGAIGYAVMERRYGVRRTGVIGMIVSGDFRRLQDACLLIAVASIWIPGSPSAVADYFQHWSFSMWWTSLLNSFSPSSSPSPTFSSPIDWSSFSSSDGSSLASIFAFLIGIATARFGLWMADLAITHIMQIAIAESERNSVFGVHNAICQTFSVLKDLLVIALPSPTTFAICILISFGFVLSGFLSYLYYIFKTRGEEEEEQQLVYQS